MMYGEIKDPIVYAAELGGCTRTMGILEQSFEQIFPEDKEKLEFLKDMRNIIMSNFKDYGAAYMPLEKCSLKAKSTKEFLIETYNAPKDLEIWGLGISGKEQKKILKETKKILKETNWNYDELRKYIKGE